jgi:FkbM family methyltransferase
MLRPSSRKDLEAVVRWLVSRRATRRCLNHAYNCLSLVQKKSFYASFAKMFREHPQHVAEGEWWVNIGGRWATLPLGGHDTWLEWDLAVSMLGHEVEIKRTYLDLIRFRRPRLFFDIGANYGLHSVFFLVHGVPTVSFEPNVRCHDYFRKIAGRNSVPCDIQQLALGAEEGWAEIFFPETETWLGSTNPAVQDELIKGHGGISRIRVPQTTLDCFTQRYGRQPDLIKIDTEGNEAEILRGGLNTLRTCRPWVIFESWRDISRERLFTLFADVAYSICTLPFQHPRQPIVLDRTRLLEWPETNLIALPIEDVGSSRTYAQRPSRDEPCKGWTRGLTVGPPTQGALSPSEPSKPE